MLFGRSLRSLLAFGFAASGLAASTATVLGCDICRAMARSRVVYDIGASSGFGATCSASTMSATLSSESGPPSGLTLSAPRPPSSIGSFDIALVSGTGLSNNQQAQAAFDRAVAKWESYIADPITITINANLSSNFTNANTIGQAASVYLYGGYNAIRNQMVADGNNNPLLNALPTASQLSVLIPSGFTLTGSIAATKANLKAMGFDGLDQSFGASDGTIEFNTQFPFDYDNSDGVTPGTMDFETVALHEIGHVLGFVSMVDDVDALLYSGTTAALDLTPIDLFRFQDGGQYDPSSLAEFTTMPRYLAPGSTAIFDTIDAEYGLSTGYYTGDGRQASHWIDGAANVESVGVMDPTLSYQQTFTITSADLRAFSLIGYDIAVAVPEPSTILLAGFGIGAVALWRRRR